MTFGLVIEILQKIRSPITKYFTTILRLSYDNAIVTIDLRRMSNLLNILQRTQGFSSVYDSLAFLQDRNIARDSVRKLA